MVRDGFPKSYCITELSWRISDFSPSKINLPNILEEAAELNSKCFTCSLLKFTYSEDSTVYFSLSISFFIFAAFQLMSAYIPSQVKLQLKVFAEFCSMQSLPAVLHIFLVCMRKYIGCQFLAFYFGLPENLGIPKVHSCTPSAVA